MPLLKVPVTDRSPIYNYGPGALLENETRLYDLAADPARNARSTTRGRSADGRAMAGLMQATEAPPEAFGRLSRPGAGGSRP